MPADIFSCLNPCLQWQNGSLSDKSCSSFNTSSASYSYASNLAACPQVELDLDFNAYANARAHYEKRKQHMVKQQKTVDANEKALKAAEKKAQHQLSQVRTKTAIQHVRKRHWFEKFNWFVTSENYLVISGRDAQQNELIVKRYLKKGLPCILYFCLYVSAGLLFNVPVEHMLLPCVQLFLQCQTQVCGRTKPMSYEIDDYACFTYALGSTCLGWQYHYQWHSSSVHAGYADKSGLQHECCWLWPQSTSG